MSFRFYGEPQEDNGLRQMILISAVLHLIVVLWVIISASLGPSTPPRAVAYTVELVNPASLGTNLPGGGKREVRTETRSSDPPKSPPPAQPQRETKPPQQVAKKEEPKLSVSRQKEAVKITERAKPVEKPPVKPEAAKAKIEEQKPETKKEKPKPESPKIAKIAEPPPKVRKPEPKKEEAKSESKKANLQKVEEKKPEPKEVQTKPQKNEPKPEKMETKPKEVETRTEVAKSSLKAIEKNPEEKPAKVDVVSPEDRDRQIAAALDRIKARVQPQDNPEVTEEVRGTGPVTKGGAASEGGGGLTRGLEFIMYTQQLQRRVQESWIVTEKKPGMLASVSFKIQPNGEVQELEVTQSSGDGVFDQSVVRAIRKAAPFPPPPQAYAQEFATQKIFMNFGGEGRIN